MASHRQTIFLQQHQEPARIFFFGLPPHGFLRGLSLSVRSECWRKQQDCSLCWYPPFYLFSLFFCLDGLIEQLWAFPAIILLARGGLRVPRLCLAHARTRT